MPSIFPRVLNKVQSEEAHAYLGMRGSGHKWLLALKYIIKVTTLKERHQHQHDHKNHLREGSGVCAVLIFFS